MDHIFHVNILVFDFAHDRGEGFFMLHA
jgi:hypothetical protein